MSEPVLTQKQIVHAEEAITQLLGEAVVCGDELYVARDNFGWSSRSATLLEIINAIANAVKEPDLETAVTDA